MIWIYRILVLPGLVLAVPYFLWLMRRRGGHVENLGHRFGGTDPLPPKVAGRKRVWLQAVSVGEMLAIAPLLEAFRREGNAEVYLTTTTSTGYRLAQEKYAALTIGIGYFPFDFWAFSERAWWRVRPDLCILMEGERWPEHVHQAALHGVPVLSINARLSDRSYRRLMRFRSVVGPLSRGITRTLCAARRDEQRFKLLGFPAERLVTTGNMKLDVDIPLLPSAELARLRHELGLGDGLVLLGSSTWPGEEAALLAALQSARRRGLVASLLLVPRHSERREELRALLDGSGFTFHFRSVGPAPGPVDVVVGDTTGELRKFTQLADLVFVGKSLAPHDGGQTPVEAAILEKPLLHGPHMTNFRQIIRGLTEAGAVRKVETHEELTRVAVDLLADEAQRKALTASAHAWHEANRGATERTVAVIREMLRR
ncbi:3-deoxy-D-manno-octulosonic acid transferase [Lacunisphaera limnophila]|uniref:3-deoxy-D-manno-octulosonic acid transferase n=1 Tax=Lacunisphaera limnophila TaxID=1838286 RepID=A0A1D8AWF2_9BACT|nr:3-deoxy-D-manno-octulosonic acid transferase [Lacunisphaera limnophila]